MESYATLATRFVRSKLLRLRETLDKHDLPDVYEPACTRLIRHIDSKIAMVDALAAISSSKKDLLNGLFEIKMNLPAIEDIVQSVKSIGYFDNRSIHLIQALANLHPDVSRLLADHSLFIDHNSFAVLQTRLKKIERDSGAVGLPFLFYVPISEQASLLSAPAITHELGHIFTQYYEDELFHDFDERYGVSQFIMQAKSRLLRFSNKIRKAEKAKTYNHVISNWYEWRFEIACDLFATYLLGPAFALYMKSFLVGGFPFKDTTQIHTHPSANLRMQIIMKLLEKKNGKSTLQSYLMDGWSEFIEVTGEDDSETIDMHEWSEQFIVLYVNNISTVYDSLGFKFVSLPTEFYGMDKEFIQKFKAQSLVEAINLIWFKKVISNNEILQETHDKLFEQFIS